MHAKRLQDFVANNGAAGITTPPDTYNPLLTAYCAVNEAITASVKVETKHADICDKLMEYDVEERRLRWDAGSLGKTDLKLLELFVLKEDMRKFWHLGLDRMMRIFGEAGLEGAGVAMPRKMVAFLEQVSMKVQDLLALAAGINELLDSGLGVRGA